MTTTADQTLPPIIEATRPPRPPLDPQWSDATLARILAEPSTSRRPSRAPTRASKVAIGVTGFAVLGVGAAAAAGITPQSFFRHSFVDSFAGWDQTSPDPDPRQLVDPATAERVRTAPGPGGTTFTLVAAEGTEGYTCVAALFETPASVANPKPTAFVDANGSQCDALPPGTAFATALAVDVLRQPADLGEQAVTVYSASAGSATRAVLRTKADADHPVVLFDGRFYGWYAGDPSQDRAVLTAYDATGAVVGRTRL